MVVLAAAVVIGWKLLSGSQTYRSTESRPVAYVEDRSCAECHAKQSKEWLGSNHQRAMQPATAETVLGDFNGVTFSQHGASSRFFRKDARFFVNTEGSDGKPADFEIKYTFGVEPLQQYLVEFPGGRLQCLTIAWDTVRKRWFSLYPGEKFATDDPLYWTGRYQNWNMMCAECHTTDFKKGYDPAADTYRSSWSEINVGCQACHGPGGDHVAWARKGGRDAAGGLVVGFKGADSRYEVDACATCHSRRGRIASGEHPGRPLYDTLRPEPLRAGLYHADGQQLDEVYAYGSFRQSKMYSRGVRCTDCTTRTAARPGPRATRSAPSATGPRGTRASRRSRPRPTTRPRTISTRRARRAASASTATCPPRTT